MSVLKSRGANGKAAREKLLQMRKDQSGWTKERDEEMLKMILKGATYQVVADHLDVSRSAISGRIDRLKDRFSGLLAGEDGRPASIAMAAFETGLTATAGEALYRLICKGLGPQAI
jgi:DNA-binding CsgD family transcriptional regulator